MADTLITLGNELFGVRLPLGEKVEEIDRWFIDTNINLPAALTLFTAWRRPTTGALRTGMPVGTGMTVAAGIWSFPSTGYWAVSVDMVVSSTLDPLTYIGFEIVTSTDNFATFGTYVSGQYTSLYGTGAYGSINSGMQILKITNITTDKIKIYGWPSTVNNTYSAASNVHFIKIKEI